jgi:hypothetical protein
VIAVAPLPIHLFTMSSWSLHLPFSLSFLPGLAPSAKLGHNAPFVLPTKTVQEIN